MTLQLLLPDWPAPAGVHAACSLREGGVSPQPYASLNLGDHVGDDEANVRENRRRFVHAIGVRPVLMKQVHGTRCVEIDASTEDGIEADACFTSSSGVACAIMVADCMPVLLCDRRGGTIAAAHAGWRGLAGGVIEAAASHVPSEGALAWLGPCIGPRKFEVGPEVKAAFETQDACASRHFRPHTQGKWLCDLPALARDRLARIGISKVHGNDGSDAWCTVTDASRFFSHRRDRVSGRFAACIWRD